jgi:glycosyltransferase involved in cell wall biosynthesis
MANARQTIRVLYSFPHKLGAERICYTAWQQVNGLAAAGAEVLVFPGAIHRAVPPNVKVRPTLAWGKVRIPYRLLGTRRACALHDYIVSKRIEKLAGQIDIIHAWPLGALRTLKTGARLGIPTVLERPNAHTRFAYEVVRKECQRLGVAMPPGHEHAYNPAVLEREEREYDLADYLLCPSDFVARTFKDQGFPASKLARHHYGFDEKLYYPDSQKAAPNGGLTFLFAGGCAPRKGLHFALDAWLQSSAHEHGTFLIAGSFIPGYAEKLSTQLAHPSVKVLGYRNDLPDLMRRSDVFVLPSIEEGSALVSSEARGCGCVLAVSDTAGAVCNHNENALVHCAGDTLKLAQHMNLLHEDRALLKQLREASLSTVSGITWNAAGVKLLEVYQQILDARSKVA